MSQEEKALSQLFWDTQARTRSCGNFRLEASTPKSVSEAHFDPLPPALTLLIAMEEIARVNKPSSSQLLCIAESHVQREKIFNYAAH